MAVAPFKQGIIHGQPRAGMDARDYHRCKPLAMEAALASCGRLRRQYDAVVDEGAGGPAEINLREPSLDRIADAASGLLAALEALPGFRAGGPDRAAAPPAPRRD